MVRNTDKSREFSFHLLNKRLDTSLKTLRANGFSKKEIEILLSKSF